MPKTITLTSKAGDFFFDCPVVLSRAKLIRDTITAQCMSPRADLPKIRSEADCRTLLLHVNGNLIQNIPFSVCLTG